MTKCKWKSALFAGLIVLASAAIAEEHDLPNPPQSAFVDAESAVNVSLPTDEGRRIRLTLAFDPMPSNAVQVAFGNDLNGSENLEPEETEMVVGCDCGVWFVRDEVERRGGGGQWNLTTSISNRVSGLLEVKQPRERWNLAKVTTHNLADTNLVVTAEFYDRGKLLFLR